MLITCTWDKTSECMKTVPIFEETLDKSYLYYYSLASVFQVVYTSTTRWRKSHSESGTEHLRPLGLKLLYTR